MAKIVDTVRDEKIPVIFYEELTEPRTAEIICGETGCAMRLFHSCHNVSRDEFEAGVGYLSLMNGNLENLRRRSHERKYIARMPKGCHGL